MVFFRSQEEVPALTSIGTGWEDSESSACSDVQAQCLKSGLVLLFNGMSCPPKRTATAGPQGLQTWPDMECIAYTHRSRRPHSVGRAIGEIGDRADRAKTFDRSVEGRGREGDGAKPHDQGRKRFKFDRVSLI